MSEHQDIPLPYPRGSSNKLLENAIFGNLGFAVQTPIKIDRWSDLLFSGEIPDNLVLPQPMNDFKLQEVANANNTQKTDSNNELVIYGYNQCSNHSNKITQQYKGLVFEGEKLISRGFSFTQEYNISTETSFINAIFDTCEWENIKFYETVEGSSIRLFHNNGKWYISTYRKLDAYHSKWSSDKSFGQMFEDAIYHQYQSNVEFKNYIDGDLNGKVDEETPETPETGTIMSYFNEYIETEKIHIDSQNVMQKFLNHLLIGYQYNFIISNDYQNRIVCDAPEMQSVYFVGTLVSGKWDLDLDSKCGGLPKPTRVHITERNKFYSTFSEISDYKKSPGLVAFMPDNSQFKITNSDYLYYFKIRGNSSSINYRYLQLLQKQEIQQNTEQSYGNDDDINALKFLYPGYRKEFDIYDQAIEELSLYIYNSYVTRFIKKEYSVVSKSQYKVVKKIHSWYTSDRKRNRVTYNKVLSLVKEQPTTNLNRIIKNWIRN
jgi:hypothetical protein